jgi:hypothetical protein
MLNIKTDYIIVGKLRGPIIAAEGVCSFGSEDSRELDGLGISRGVHTDGSNFGGKERWFSALPGWCCDAG